MNLAPKKVAAEVSGPLAAQNSSGQVLKLHPNSRQLELAILSSFGRFSKRSFDIFFSLLIFLLILWWMIPLLALLIKLSSKGPVFFTQQRTGRYNQPFTCYKLRSMYVNDDAHTRQAISNDPRITPAGRLLRKLSLDELPQFYNVLIGDMSIVGPRPHMLHHSETYAALVKEYPKRLLVRPGITGLSQVEGYRGEIKETQMIRNRVILDIFYIKNWAFSLDVYIVLKTVKLVIWGDKNAY